jgi:ribosomal protein S18 acetylase RimI-like enzyme
LWPIFIFDQKMVEQIILAKEQHIGEIVHLLNKAYRGESSKAGWTTEAELIEGETRADDAMVAETMRKAQSAFLIYQSPNSEIQGCINLQVSEAGVYVGMFAVDPYSQGAGIGRKLMIAAEAFAREHKQSRLYMTVISLRNDLINWYKRLGYSDNGKRIPFEEDGVSGKHRLPLEFMELEKMI